MTTNAYIRGVKHDGWPPFDQRLWHRNYYERIVRDDAARDAIRRYTSNGRNFTFCHSEPQRGISRFGEA